MASPAPRNVLVVADPGLARRAIAAGLSATPGIGRVDVCTPERVDLRLETTPPDDIVLLGADRIGREALLQWRFALPSLRIIVVVDDGEIPAELGVDLLIPASLAAVARRDLSVTVDALARAIVGARPPRGTRQPLATQVPVAGG